jgi:hypothetical protein
MKLEVAMYKLDKVYWRAKNISRDKEGHCIFIKRINSENITNLSIYAHSNRALKYMKQKLEKRQIHDYCRRFMHPFLTNI